MLKFKRVITVVCMAILFMMSLNTEVNASSKLNQEDNVALSEMLKSIYTNSDGTGFENVNMGNLFLSSQLPLFDQNGKFMSNKEMRLLYEGEQPVALFTKSNINGENFYSINADFGRLITSEILNQQQFYLKYDEKNELQLITQQVITTVKTGKRVLNTNKEFVRLESLPVNTQETKVVVNIAPLASSKYLTVPYVAQGDGDCWAASAISFGKYYTSSANVDLVTATNYANSKKPNGSGFEKAALIDSYYFYINTYYNEDHTKMKVSQIMTSIDSNHPVLVSADNASATIGHMFIVRGYSQSSSGYTLSFRDSNFSSYTTVYGSSETFVYDLPAYGEAMYYTGFMIKS